MKRVSWRRLGWSVVLSAFLGLTGCVERRYLITSEPPGAFVHVNGQPLGPAPVDGHFIYYGDYDVTLTHEGYETLKVRQKLRTPWYQYPVLDFVSENLVPWTIKDVRRLPTYQLQPRQLPRTDDVINRAQELQSKAATIGTAAPRESPPPPASPPGAPPPP